MGLFDKKKKVSPKKFGKLLGEVLRETLSNNFERKNLLIIQKQFIERDWKFNYPRYSLEIMKMYITMIDFMIVSNYHFLENNSIDQINQKFMDNWFGVIPKEHVGDITQTSIYLLQSDQPLLTVSRIAAENYFGKDKVDPEKVIYFGASARAFNDVLETLKKEVNVK